MLIHTTGMMCGILTILFGIVYYSDVRCIPLLIMGIGVIIVSYVGKREVEKYRKEYKLCPIGFKLWDSCWIGNNWSMVKYEKYRKHIINCYECQKGLELDEYIIDLIRKDIGEN